MPEPLKSATRNAVGSSSTRRRQRNVNRTLYRLAHHARPCESLHFICCVCSMRLFLPISCPRVFISRLTACRCSHKSLKIKKTLAVNRRRNRPLPNWIRYRTDNTIRYNSKRKHWRRTKLGL